MADTLIYVCRTCGKTSNTWDRCCDRHMTMFVKEEWDNKNKQKTIGISYDHFTPYVEENLGSEPVFIGSRSERKRILKERGMEIMPASNRRASPEPIYVFQS